METSVEIFYDDSVEEWGYVIPALAIIGIGCGSEQEATRAADEAVNPPRSRRIASSPA